MRVAHVPSRHPYVQAIDPDAVMLDDPWSIDQIVDGSVDAVHVHFGFEHLSADALAGWAESVREAGVVLVHTVHDVDNPHLIDQTPHHRRTQTLVEASDVVTTLTDSAADRVERQWGRRPVVIPHPPLASTRNPRRPDVTGGGLLWLGTVRPNLDVEATVTFLTEAEMDVEVVVREDAVDRLPDSIRAAATTSNGHARTSTVAPRPTDSELEELVASAGVLVLPYAWGTHSGLVELATDLGVACVTTDSGSRADQGAATAPRLELAAAARRVLDTGHVPHRPEAAGLAAVRAAHRRLYADSRTRDARD